MYYESVLDKLMDEDNHEIIKLQTEDGTESKFEQIAVINYEKEIYAILRPLELKEDQVVVFKVNPYDEGSMDLVLDEALSNKVLEVYKQNV